MPKKKTDRSDRKLTSEEQSAMRKAIAAAYKFLKLKPGCSPQKIQKTIFATIESVYRGKKKNSEKALDDLGFNLGCLWGQTVCDSFNWEWCIVDAETDPWIAVVSPNRSHAVSGMFIAQELQKRYPKDIDSLILFNMIAGGKFNKGKRTSYVVIG